MTKPSNSKNRSPTFGYVLIGIGLLLMVFGLSWKQIIPPETFWSEQDAMTYAAVMEAAHAATIKEGHQLLGHDHAHNHSAEGSVPKLAPLVGDAATPREQFERARDLLKEAKLAHQRTGQYLAALGAVIALAGMVINKKKRD